MRLGTVYVLRRETNPIIHRTWRFGWMRVNLSARDITAQHSTGWSIVTVAVTMWHHYDVSSYLLFVKSGEINWPVFPDSFALITTLLAFHLLRAKKLSYITYEKCSISIYYFLYVYFLYCLNKTTVNGKHKTISI